MNGGSWLGAYSVICFFELELERLSTLLTYSGTVIEHLWDLGTCIQLEIALPSISTLHLSTAA